MSFLQEVYESINYSTNTETIYNYLVNRNYSQKYFSDRISEIGKYRKNLSLEKYRYLTILLIKEKYAPPENYYIPDAIFNREEYKNLEKELNIELKNILTNMTGINFHLSEYNIKLKEHLVFLTIDGKRETFNSIIQHITYLLNKKKEYIDHLFFERRFNSVSHLHYFYDKTIKNVECPICMENSSEYYTYQCNHSTCKECSEKLIFTYLTKKTDNVKCALCRTIVETITHN